MDDQNFPADWLAGLAVYGDATTAELAALLHDKPCKLDLNKLTSGVGIAGDPDRWWMTAAQAELYLAALHVQDAEAAYALQQRALQLDAPRIVAGEHQLEPRFGRILNRLATQLMQDAPAIFQQLIAWSGSFAFHHAPLRQLCSYFEAVSLARQDRYGEALERLALLLAEPTLEPELRGRVLNSQAIYLQLTGQIELALQGYGAALTLWQSVGNRTRQGMALLNLGILSYQLQHYTESKRSLLEAATCFEATDNGYQLASVQNQLGLVYRDQGLLAEAYACFAAVAAQRRAIGDQESLGRALNNRGEVLLFQGKLDGAASDFAEALHLLQSRTFAVDVYLNLGLTHQGRGQLEAAEQAFQTALTTAQAIGRRDILAEIHYRLAEVWRRIGKHALALEQFEAAARVIDASQRTIHSEQLRIGLLGRWQQVYEALVLHCWRMGEIERAFAWAERARARAFADVLQTAERRQRQQVETPATAAALLAALPPHHCFLCYFTTGVLEQEMPLLATLKRDHPLAEHLLLPAKTLCFEFINQQLRLRDCTLDPNAFASLSPRQDRHRLLVPAILRRLHGSLLPADLSGQQCIYLAPHGPIHQVPFVALLDANAQPFLHTGEAPLVYTPSGSILLQRLRVTGCEWRVAGEGNEQGCLAVGCNDAGSWGELRHSEQEATLIAHLCQGIALTGSASKLDRLRQRAGEWRWLHFACHGWFDPNQPLASYLQTAPNERLLAQEVLDSWHLRAELVTLSACQSGVQKVLRSDEPMGLVRGFLAAGARWVVATQWSVADLPTFLLMLHFYRQLTADARFEPAVALRSAQAWLRSLSLSQVQQLAARLPSAAGELPKQAYPFAEPRFWAAFVIYGG